MLNNVEETQEVSINQIEYCVQYVDSYFCLCQDHTSNILNNSKLCFCWVQFLTLVLSACL